VLEEVMTNASFAPKDYLEQLILLLGRKEERGGQRLVNGAADRQGMEIAIRKMEEVRLALARNLARALVVGFDNPF
jgi:nuclear pore complex protein Nup85